MVFVVVCLLVYTSYVSLVIIETSRSPLLSFIFGDERVTSKMIAENPYKVTYALMNILIYSSWLPSSILNDCWRNDKQCKRSAIV